MSISIIRNVENFIAELHAQGIVTRPVAECMQWFKDRDFIDQLQFFIDAYDEDRHFDWASYRDQAARQLTARFGESWKHDAAGA